MNSGEIIKKIRLGMGLSQEDFATKLHVSSRQVPRIENGTASMSMWKFMYMIELLDRPTEELWLLYLDTEEYDGYKKYVKLKRLLSNRLFDEAKDILPEFEKGVLSKQPTARQYLAYAKIVINKEDMSHEKVIDELFLAMRISKPNFEENKITEYRMTHNELYIANTIANTLYKIGEKDRSIKLAKGLIESMENSGVSEEDKAILFPLLMTNLSTNLGRSGKIKEALKVCNRALEICREYNNFKYVHHISYNIAYCYKELGEEEQVYKTHLVRAYHSACAVHNHKDAVIIKNDAKKSFGITLS